MKVELVFVVDKVLNSQNPAEQWLEAVQTPDYSLPYRGARLMLPIIDDDELKKYGPGLQLRVTVES